ncbi:tripartite tricarboxylate transporter TctB family protein [Devosia sp. XJ19-1]|uniref:Tripartite tricarboxylate transporter TctB family protein n=1 Tax=Devosia ureilytica TaxID=2952754 RepID=A0A9Q4AQS7_9HYPH|nr:tripartite tricarboxylate transporter TctB family protein [Devosia ureilytica]MCP8884448.1 tripartite tricarboxylate transporter TctB family protein [Devosia ureilytica]MCP8888056.1 tripartite tricarboxylate transporter TctB family protein [Devosia ureilytica]
MGEWTRVEVDFATSHLIFPTLIGIVLLILGAAILITQQREVLGSGAMWRETLSKMDKPRFFGGLGLTILYFSLMVPVGDFWPNTGMGFLLCSIPFVALTGILFMHERTLRSMVPVLIIALAGPLLVWWLFSDIFYLTLP